MARVEAESPRTRHGARRLVEEGVQTRKADVDLTKDKDAETSRTPDTVVMDTSDPTRCYTSALSTLLLFVVHTPSCSLVNGAMS